MLQSLFKKSRSAKSGLASSNDSQRLLNDAQIVYPPNTLLGLPNELLKRIFQYLRVEDFLSLALVCHQLNDFVNKTFLYRKVKIRNMASLQKFKKTISRDKKHNQLQLYVHSIEFVKPEKDTSKEKENIGAFSFRSPSSSDSYIVSLLEVISLLPNLAEVSLRQVSPVFQFPEWTSSLKTYALEHNYYPTLRKLSMSSQQGWTIPLRPNLLWAFGVIEELVLYDMVIDSISLMKPALLTLANENGPLVAKDALTLESTNRWSPIQSLTLSSCSIASNGFRFLSEYFRVVKTLKLKSIKSYYDILLSNCFPQLENLYIDLNSKCFSLYNSSEASVINATNNNSNYAYVNSMFVPKFYLNYPHFVDVLNRVPNVEKISFINVSFTNITPVSPDDTSNPLCNQVNNNGYNFLVLLRRFKRVEFIMLKNYKLHQPRSRSDWEKLLEPCFTSQNSLRVLDKDGSVLFSRNERT